MYLLIIGNTLILCETAEQKGFYMEDLVKKEPIVPTLRELEIGESHSFPIEQRSSVYVSCQRMVKEGMRIGWNYEMVEHAEDFTVEVRRIS